MFTVRCTTTSALHSLTKMWLSEKDMQDLAAQVTAGPTAEVVAYRAANNLPPMGRSDQWDLVTIDHSRMGRVSEWTPETGWTVNPAAVKALMAS